MRTRVWTLALACVAALAPTGCLLGDVTGIPCGADDECPSDAFCHLSGGVCIATAGVDGAPSVKILGIDVDGEAKHFARVTAGEPATVELHLKNEGGYVAEEISIELSKLWCAPMAIDAADVPARLDPGKVAKMTLRFDIEPECANPVPVDWFVRFSGRQHRGTFEMFHEYDVSNDYPGQD